MKTKTCPECDYGSTHKPAHAARCSRATVDDLRNWFNDSQWWNELYKERITQFRLAAERWEGKFRVVKHENNMLRKSLKPKN